MDVMIELGLHLGRRAFPVENDGRIILTLGIWVYHNVPSWCAEEESYKEEGRQ